ncbi:hypothetical protein ACLOAV_005097 [Pseudogymnoascus australis]
MKISSLVTTLAIVSVSQAWHITFWGHGNKHVSASGTERNECNNLRSDYDQSTDSIQFSQKTANWPDPTGYTAYASTGCRGKRYYGTAGTHYPNMRIRSYRVTSN